MNKGFFIGLFISGLAVPFSAFAQYVAGQSLKEWLSAQERIERGQMRSTDYQDAALSMGYVLGVVDAHVHSVVCPGSEVKAGQLRAMVAKYLEDNPDKWDQPAERLVLSALKARFPCKR